MVNFKIYDVTKWEANNCKYMLPDISQSKDNQAMKFGQIKEYNMINIFIKKSCTKCGGQTSSRSFFKKLKLSTYLHQQSEVSYSLFLLHVQVGDYQNILKLTW